MARPPVQALIRALRFDTPDTGPLCALTDDEWRALLDFTDQAHITLALAIRHRDILPQWVRDRLDRNLAGNAERTKRLQAAYRQIAAELDNNGIDWLVLKGFSHEIAWRPQYDIDLLCTREGADTAQQIVIALGYEPITMLDEFAADHLPLLIRRTGWRWRDDYYDPEQPPNIEIHFRVWDPGTERIALDGTEEFWSRRVMKEFDGLQFPALDPLDTLAYAALHVSRHLFRGDLLLWHIYELGLLLERRATDEPFWAEWNTRYSDSLRGFITVAFRLANKWFGCRLTALPFLPDSIERWFEVHAQEPTGMPLLRDKSELWLHVSLLSSRRDVIHTIRRRLLPTQKRRPMHHTQVLPSDDNLRVKLDRTKQYVKFIASRAAFHTRTLPRAAAHGLMWWLRSRGLSSGFIRFLGAAAIFNFGMTVFFMLYNLLLVKRGFHEDFLGPVATAMTLGTIAGTIPAGLIMRRFGLKSALLFGFVGVPLICVLRVLVVVPSLLIASAFVGGFVLSMYQVSLAPIVAQLVPEKARPLAFSMVFSFGIGIGVLGSIAGGALPNTIGGLQPTLIAVSAIAALGAVAALKLPLRTPQNRTRNLYPRDPAITRYLAALALWSLATGALNPFFNVYFATQLKAPLPTIGAIFSGSQLTQVIAVLTAPLVLKRLGMPAGVMAMQILTGASLGLLALQPPLMAAAVLYSSYMAFQYMSEPGMFSFLMDHAKEEERGGAAALNILVIFGGQAIAATISGFAIRRFGYAVVLTAASLLAIVAGLCFRFAMSRETPVLLGRSVAR